MDDLNSELGRVMAERQAMYRFLARLYCKEVDSELLQEISQMDFSADTGVPDIDQGFQMLGRYLHAVNETTLTDLAADYARIFLGAGPKQAGGAFPYESVYTSPRGLLMQEARDQVVAFYRQEGIQRSVDFHESEDHIALELEFVAHLCEKTAQALDAQDVSVTARYLQTQNVFLESHLCGWAPRLCADVTDIAATDFYKAIAAITTGYLAIDQNLIADLLIEPAAQVEQIESAS
jgi:putative dimethyl sulfoxide reductase chaperone